MEELDGFKRRIDSVIQKAYEGGVTLLPFLDDAEMGIVEEKMKWQGGISYSFFGGIKNSDRKRCIISPYEIKNEDFKIHIFEILYNKKYYELYHRSILGALMGLGIKRDAIGDILLMDDKRVFFAATDEIHKFLIEEFHFVGKAPIELKEYYEPLEAIIKYEAKIHFLSSLRLDVIIAGGFQMSRSEALECIQRGDVFIHHILTLNPSHSCILGDEISVRHKGRIKITKLGGTTKSGRLAVEISKRI